MTTASNMLDRCRLAVRSYSTWQQSDYLFQPRVQPLLRPQQRRHLSKRRRRGNRSLLVSSILFHMNGTHPFCVWQKLPGGSRSTKQRCTKQCVLVPIPGQRPVRYPICPLIICQDSLCMFSQIATPRLQSNWHVSDLASFGSCATPLIVRNLVALVGSAALFVAGRPRHRTDRSRLGESKPSHFVISSLKRRAIRPKGQSC